MFTGDINLPPPNQNSCFTAISSHLQLCCTFENFPSRSPLWKEASWGKSNFTLSFSTNKGGEWEYSIDAHIAHALCKIQEEFRSSTNFWKKFHMPFGRLKVQLETFPTPPAVTGTTVFHSQPHKEVIDLLLQTLRYSCLYCCSHFCWFLLCYFFFLKYKLIQIYFRQAKRTIPLTKMKLHPHMPRVNLSIKIGI